MERRLKYDPLDYLDVQRMRNATYGFDEKELRKVYHYYRDIAVKRVKRLQAAGYDLPAGTEQLGLGIPKLKELTRRTLPYELQQLAAFIRLERSTVSGQKAYRKNRIRGLRKAGYDVDEQTFDLFTDFMDSVRGRLIEDVHIDSEIALQVLRLSRRLKLNPNDVMRDMEWWAQNVHKITYAKDRKRIGITDGMSSEQIQALVNKAKK